MDRSSQWESIYLVRILSQSTFMEDVFKALKETNTQPKDIVFELTESTFSFTL